MNILGSLQRWGTSLLSLVTESPAEVEAKEAGAEGSDGPGAGGGYETKDSVDIQSDGPGAGGGYDSKALIVVDSDGPGAGGGYDGDSDDDGPGAGGGYEPTQNLVVLSDGPGAGGGYSGISSMGAPVDLMSYQASTEEISRAIGSTSTTFTQENSDYFLTDGLAAKSYVDGQKSVSLTNKSWTVLPELQAEAMSSPKESQQKSEDKK